MKYIRVFLLIVLLIAVRILGHSQTYETALGLRVDRGFGLSLQQYLENKWTMEIIGHLPISQPDLGLTVLAERHHKIIVRNLNFYYGAGGHYYRKSAASRQEDSISERVFGLSFIGGAELSLGRINVSADFKPELHFAGDQVHPFEWPGAAVSVRYIFVKRSRPKVREWEVWDDLGLKKKKKKRR